MGDHLRSKLPETVARSFLKLELWLKKV